MTDAIRNFARANVNAFASGATTITVPADIARFPDPATDGEFNLVVWNVDDYPDPADDPNREIVRVTAKSGNDFTIIRGQESTSDVNHNTSGSQHRVILTITKKTMDDVFTSLTSIGVKIWDATVNYSLDNVAICLGALYVSKENGNSDNPSNAPESAGSVGTLSGRKTTQMGGTAIYSIRFNEDGTKMFYSRDGVLKSRILSTPFDITTKGVETSYSLNAAVYYFDFADDGKKFYHTNSSNSPTFYEYTLSTAFDINSKTYIRTGGIINNYGFAISNDGTKLLASYYNSDIIYGYTLSTAFDISTAVYAQSKSMSGFRYLLGVSKCGKSIYGGYYNNQYIQAAYIMETPWDISTAVADTNVNNYATARNYIRGGCVAGGKVFTGYSSGGYVYSHDFIDKFNHCSKWKKLN